MSLGETSGKLNTGIVDKVKQENPRHFLLILMFYVHCVPEEGGRVGGGGNQNVEGDLLTFG